ncbi:hypothetical protein PINS_up014574 [Pythium insidiosum]|nr:hypothetical protein PINS_up014574 [Pythium insidiosum]
MVQSNPDDGIARNLLAEIEAEAKSDGGGTPPDDGSPMVDAPAPVVDLTEEEPVVPQTPATRAMNVFPPQFPPNWLPSRALELLTAKNEVLKCFTVTKVGPSGEMRDPGFAVMNDPHQIVRALIGVFNAGGCSVSITDPHKIASFPTERLRAAGQATYDLFLRDQAWKVITAAAKSSLHGLVDGSDLQKLAEKYMGYTKDEVIGMRERVDRQQAMILSLETYLQEVADEQAKLKRNLEEREGASVHHEHGAGASADHTHSSQSRGEHASTGPPGDHTNRGRSTNKGSPASSTNKKASGVKPEPYEAKYAPTQDDDATTDYLADIYDDCLAQMQGVNAATRLRAAAVTELKTFDGRSRSEDRGKGWLSSVRAAF